MEHSGFPPSLSAVLSSCLPSLSDRQMFGLRGEEVTPLGVLSPVIGCHTQLPKVGKRISWHPCAYGGEARDNMAR